MNTLHLKYAVEVERTGSITQAAENLYMGQPTLSKAIKELEASLGISIFKRTTKGVVPTRDGSVFLTYAKNILLQVNEMEAYYKEENRNLLVFKAAVGQSWYAAEAASEFYKTFSSSVTELYFDTDSANTLNDIIYEDYKIGIIQCPKIFEQYFMRFFADKDIAYETLYKYGYCVLVSKDSPLAEKNSAAISMLSELTEISCGRINVPYLSTAEARGMLPRPSKSIIYAGDFNLAAHILNADLSTYMLSAYIPPKELERNGLALIKCAGLDYPSSDFLVYQKGRKFSQFEKNFTDCIKLQLTKIPESQLFTGDLCT